MRIVLLSLLLACSSSFAAVQLNPYTRTWEGNICMTSAGWAYVPFQPVGSTCSIMTPRGPMTGFIANQ